MQSVSLINDEESDQHAEFAFSAEITAENLKKSGADLSSIDRLFRPSPMGNLLTTTSYNSIVVGKPRDFFRVIKDEKYHAHVELYCHTTEGTSDKTFYIVAPEMDGRIGEARPYYLITCVDRVGTPRLWPLRLQKDGENENEAWTSARRAAKLATDKWLRIRWERRSYVTVEASENYAPDPDITSLPSLSELVALGFGPHGVISDENHSVYRELYGLSSGNVDSSIKAQGLDF